MPELTDAEVFGATELTDSEVFGGVATEALAEERLIPPVPSRRFPAEPPPEEKLAETFEPKHGPLFARSGVLARSPADPLEALRAVGGQLLHPIKSTEAAIEQFTGAPRFSGPYAPPIKHVSELLELGPKIPKIPQQKGTAAQVGAGAVNALSSFADFFLTPGGAATLGIGSLPQAAKKMVLTEFAANMAVEQPEQLREGVRLLQEGKTQQGVELLTGGAGATILAPLIAKHVVSEPARVPGGIVDFRKETAEREAPPTSQQPGLPPTAEPIVPETAAREVPGRVEAEEANTPEQMAQRAEEALAGAAEPKPTEAPRTAIASDRLDWFATTSKEPTILTIRPDELGDLPKLGRLLTDGASTRGLNESETKRVTALEDTETGEVHLVSTYRERSTGTVRLVQPDKAGSKRPNVALTRLPERYKPIDSFLLNEPVKNLHESFPDRAAYDAAKAQLNEARQAQESLRASAEEMPSVKGEVAQAAELPLEAITDEGAGAIHDVFGGAQDIATVTARFDRMVKAPTPASEVARRELRQVAEELMNRDPGLTPIDAALKVQQWLYENVGPEITRQEFIRRATRLGQTVREVAGPEATASAAGPAPNPPVEPPLGGALTVGVDPVATAKAVVSLFNAARQNETIDRITRQLAGHSAPITMAAGEASGEALIRFASARGTGKLMGRAKAAEVLGEDFKNARFREKLGAVIVEDQLRATKAKFQSMADRESDPALKSEYQDMADAAGRLGSPFKSEAEFRDALSDPKVQAALDRHKQVVQPIAEEAHRMLGGKMMEAGEVTGTFANLIAILGEEPVQKAFGGGRGELTRPRKRPSRFFFERKGTAEKYETDYEKIASRMIEGNFDEVAKRELYDQLVQDGLAVVQKPGLPAPEIGGKKSQKFEIQRRGTPVGTTQTENLWVREDVARELRQAQDTDGAVARAGWVRAAAVANAIQLAGPTDAFFHVANMLSSISRSQGGRNMLIDLGRKLPGVNIADTLARVAVSAKRVIQDSPEIRKRIAELSDIGAMRPLREFTPSEGFRRFVPHELGGKFIQLLDVAGRLVREDLFNNLVKRGLVDDTPVNRREWVNQLGQYNPRLMTKFQREMRDFGFSPFVVAGRNFNRNAIRSLLLSQGVKAASPTAWAKMKAVDLAGLAMTIFVVSAFINYLTTGNPNGRPGTKVGEIDTGKGNIKIDPLQWTGLRRGMRITGIDALTSGARWNSSSRETKRRAGVDIVNGLIHPWAGPVPKALAIGATGYGSVGFKESKDPNDFGQNLLAAVEQLNPVVRSALKGWEGADEGDSKPGAALLETGKSLGGALGIKSRRITSAVQQLRGLHEGWALKHPDSRVRQRAKVQGQMTFGAPEDRKYGPLDKAIATGDKALIRKAYTALIRAGYSERDAWDRFSPTTIRGRERTLFNDSEELESQFFGSLRPDERKLYNEAMRDWYRRFALFQDATGIYRRPRD